MFISTLTIHLFGIVYNIYLFSILFRIIEASIADSGGTAFVEFCFGGAKVGEYADEGEY